MEHCKHLKILKCSESEHLTTSPRGIGIIPEGDVYRLTMKSRLESAVRFQDWVTDEVLPTLRKTGKFELKASEMTELEAAKQYLSIAQKYVEVVEEKEKLLIELQAATPKVKVYDVIADSEDLLELDAVAKLLAVKPRKFWDWLRMAGFMRKKGKSQNLPMQPMIDQGYMTVKESVFDNGIYQTTSVQPFFTHKGMLKMQDILEKFADRAPMEYKRLLL